MPPEQRGREVSMTTELYTDLDRSISRRFGTLGDDARVMRTASDLEEGLRRINEYVFPLEDARALTAYGVHSGVNKVLIINRELTPGRITVVFVDEVLGF